MFHAPSRMISHASREARPAIVAPSRAGFSYPCCASVIHQAPRGLGIADGRRAVGVDRADAHMARGAFVCGSVQSCSQSSSACASVSSVLTCATPSSRMASLT